MQLRTEIEIAAPPQIVWEVLTERSSYQEWNPLITSFEGKLEVGSRLNLVISPPDSSDFRIRPRVLVVEAKKELRWKTTILGEFFFSGEHFLALTELDNGRTRLTHGEDFQGFFLRFLSRQLNAAAKGFVFMNQALKRRAEEIAQGTG